MKITSHKSQIINSLSAVIFLAAVSLFAQPEASPTEPAAQKSPRQRRSERLGLQEVSAIPAGPLATVLPSSEYRKVPIFDFVPKRLRSVEE